MGFFQKEHKWAYLIVFLLGALVSYLLTQISLFNINTELNVVEFLLSLGTAVIGIYIAHTIQKNINRNQNQYSYIEDKLDTLWTSFITFSKNFEYADNIELSTITSYFKESSPTTDLLKSIFQSFEIDDKCICELETKIDDFDSFLTDLETKNSIVYFKENKSEIEKRILDINKCFKDLLKIVTEI